MINAALVPALDVVRDLAYVSLYAYGISRVSDYAINRLKFFGPETLFERRDPDEVRMLEEQEEIVLTRGTKDVAGRVRAITGFGRAKLVAPVVYTPTPSIAPSAETDEDMDERTLGESPAIRAPR
jgi:hypothetical protein